jgi:hypothetical protein
MHGLPPVPTLSRMPDDRSLWKVRSCHVNDSHRPLPRFPRTTSTRLACRAVADKGRASHRSHLAASYRGFCQSGLVHELCWQRTPAPLRSRGRGASRQRRILDPNPNARRRAIGDLAKRGKLVSALEKTALMSTDNSVMLVLKCAPSLTMREAIAKARFF